MRAERVNVGCDTSFVRHDDNEAASGGFVETVERVEAVGEGEIVADVAR